MNGKKILNPYAKVVLCALGMLCIGYYLFIQIQSGLTYDSLFVFIVRATVFLGFTYLLVRSVSDLLKSDDSDRTDSE